MPFNSDRRRFVSNLTGGLVTWAIFQAAARGTAAEPRVNAGRLQSTLEELSTFGRPAGGCFADGVSRVAYSDADVGGRAYVIGLMKAAGLDTTIDPAGNIVGRRAGSDRTARPILMGSHIDSVPSGGNFDGDVGSLSAIEVVRTLNEHKITTRHPLEVTIWSNEEGGPFGSAAVVSPCPRTVALTFNGIPMRDGLRRIGGDPDRITQAGAPPARFIVIWSYTSSRAAPWSEFRHPDRSCRWHRQYRRICRRGAWLRQSCRYDADGGAP